MKYIPANLAQLKFFTLVLVTTFVVACGGESSEPKVEEPPVITLPTAVPLNQIIHASFRDQDGATGKLAGTVTLKATAAYPQDTAPDSVWLYWADELGNKIDNQAHSVWLKTDASSLYDIIIPTGTNIPANIQAFLIYPHNAKGLSVKGILIKFHDFIGNAQLSGPGGNYDFPWYYGQPPEDNTDVAGFSVTYTQQRDTIAIHRNELQGGLCIFDNGLVSIIDMDYALDEAWVAGKGSGENAQANEANDSLFPIYQAPCAANPINTHRYVGDDYGAWTYSTINDAMFYGTIVYDTFVKYLGEPPLTEKLRIRLHYDKLGSTAGYWDGAYATFGDGFPFQYSSASLDSIAHEFGHGVLNRIMGIDYFLPRTEEEEFSKAFRTLHEAFGDISGVMAWYEYGEYNGVNNSEVNYWLHGEENAGRTRKLDQIVTEYGAIESMLDYNETQGNYYLSIGMFTYPFYVLSQQWGMDAAYRLYIAAAKSCWTATMTHTQLAMCLKQQAAITVNVSNDPSIDILPAKQKEDDVVAAFKIVKIKLFDEGVLSHYNFEKSKLRTQFTNDSRSTGQVTQWLWDFGDGTTSALENPQHTYAAAGDYRVTLTVMNDVFVENEDSDESNVNNVNHKDDFTRTVSVTDQYCGISTGYDPQNDIGQAIINDINLNFNAEQSNYSETPIALTGLNNRTLTLDIAGASDVVNEQAIKWTVWLDINDDGLYDTDEIVAVETIAVGQPYGINTSTDLTDFIIAANMDAGEAQLVRFIRVVGKNSYSSACSSAVGEAFDVRVSW